MGLLDRRPIWQTSFCSRSLHRQPLSQKHRLRNEVCPKVCPGIAPIIGFAQVSTSTSFFLCTTACFLSSMWATLIEAGHAHGDSPTNQSRQYTPRCNLITNACIHTLRDGHLEESGCYTVFLVSVSSLPFKSSLLQEHLVHCSFIVRRQAWLTP